MVHPEKAREAAPSRPAFSILLTSLCCYQNSPRWLVFGLLVLVQRGGGGGGVWPAQAGGGGIFCCSSLCGLSSGTSSWAPPHWAAEPNTWSESLRLRCSSTPADLQLLLTFCSLLGALFPADRTKVTSSLPDWIQAHFCGVSFSSELFALIRVDAAPAVMRAAQKLPVLRFGPGDQPPDDPDVSSQPASQL